MKTIIMLDTIDDSRATAVDNGKGGVQVKPEIVRMEKGQSYEVEPATADRLIALGFAKMAG